MKFLKHIFLLFAIFSLNACLEEEDVFEQPNQPVVITDTSFITTFMNEEFVTQSVLSKNCFKMVYPITVFTNNDVRLTVNHYNGFREIVNAQHDDFFVKGIALPITVTDTDFQKTTIESNHDFAELFNFCEMPTLKTTLMNKLGDCVDFEYPVTIFNTSAVPNEFNTRDDFVNFLNVQNTNFEVDFKFPVYLEKTNNSQTSVRINSYYKLYKHLNKCNIECVSPNIYFEKTNSENGYRFELQNSNNNFTGIEWFINDELAETYTNQINPEIIFPAEGNYNVCVRLKKPGCTNDLISCTPINVSSTP